MYMSNTSKNWGNSTWLFLHTFAEKINPEFYEANVSNIFKIVRTICVNLPCPDCSKHADNFFNNIHFGSITTHSGFKSMLWNFHNNVNRRLGVAPEPLQILDNYKTQSLSTTLQDFKTYYSMRYNTHIEFGFGSNDAIRIRITNNIIDWMRLFWNIFN